MTPADWDSVARLAAQPVMLAVTLAVPALLALGGRRSAAWRWLLVVGGALGLVLALKLLGALISLQGGPVALRSPSGHAAAAAIVWGGVALACGTGRRVAFAWALAMVALVAPARVLGGAHNVAEALAGAAIGLAGLALLARWLPPPPPGWRPLPLLLGVVIAGIAAAPFPLAPEPMVQALAARLLGR